MSDITAAEYRTAEKVARSLGFATAQSYADHAARLESVGVTLDVQLAQTLRQVASPSFADRADYWGTLATAALEFLTSAGRLIPAGGMALTAEQVEDVRTVVSADAAAWNRLSPALFAAYRLRRALFPATEPAEPAIQSAGGDCFDVCEGHPAPAEPAEEKTKAEGLSNVELSCLKLICDLCKKSYKGTVWLPINDMVQGFVDRHYLTRDENDSCKPTINAEKALASSPVVPAPTETGPWQTWQEVPEGVVYTSSRTPWHRWKNVKGERRHKMAAFPESPWGMSGAHEQTMAERAPFVAAEEG